MTQKLNTTYILLGSNIGNSLKILKEAITNIELLCGEVVCQSSVYETEAWGVENQQNYLNQVVEISTNLSPKKLLNTLLDIEQKLGRVRSEKWSARTLDLDILFYKDLVIKTENLTIPHPRLHLRNFTLIPLAEIAPSLVHPLFNMTSIELLNSCTDNLKVNKI
ncbi:UNVERIFIED_CONTAM: hypothetical protein GTU68_031941 [Idotea baltica]|nr:hypothetical protein [Idotea baltica]